LAVAAAIGRGDEEVSQSANVLVVDDDPLVVAILEHKLSARGYRVTTASDGVAGLGCARASRPDLIVLDMMMPVLDGRQVLQELRSDDALAAVPVVMLTARRGEGDVAGAADYIAKPFSPDELVARVSRLLPEVRAVRP
jgi:DNA-binding response OmpR family regulator